MGRITKGLKSILFGAGHSPAGKAYLSRKKLQEEADKARAKKKSKYKRSKRKKKKVKQSAGAGSPGTTGKLRRMKFSERERKILEGQL
jgi:hypothetical protein